MMKSNIAKKMGLKADHRGVAAVEFALALPLLMILFCFVLEVTRLWLEKRAFENAFIGVTRMASRYPEYDSRVRAYAPILADAMMPGNGSSNINMSIESYVKTNGALQTQMSRKTLLGSGTTIPSTGHISAADYSPNESIIFTTASYQYQPLFSAILGRSITFEKYFVTLPFFSQSYVYKAQTSPDIYVY